MSQYCVGSGMSDRIMNRIAAECNCAIVLTPDYPPLGRLVVSTLPPQCHAAETLGSDPVQSSPAVVTAITDNGEHTCDTAHQRLSVSARCLVRFRGRATIFDNLVASGQGIVDRTVSANYRIGLNTPPAITRRGLRAKPCGWNILTIIPWGAIFYGEEFFLLLCFQYFAGI